MDQHHLGERRFLEYPLFVGNDLQSRLHRTRRTLLAAVALGVALTVLMLMILR